MSRGPWVYVQTQGLHINCCHTPITLLQHECVCVPAAFRFVIGVDQIHPAVAAHMQVDTLHIVCWMGEGCWGVRCLYDLTSSSHPADISKPLTPPIPTS